ncbi:unnamed protein product, partial [Prunus brigantina]
MTISSPNSRIIDSEYPGLRFSICKFLHDPREKDISKKLDLELNMAKPAEREESSIELPDKRKANARSSKDEAATSRARDIHSERLNRQGIPKEPADCGPASEQSIVGVEGTYRLRDWT